VTRELWLLRHGKAERYDGNEDYDRRLKKRGKRDAARMGKWLKEKGLMPDLVISSPAARANMTAKIICDALNIANGQIQLEKRLYDEGLVRVKSVLADCPVNVNRVLLVGHNPELEGLLTFLAKSIDIPKDEKILPTAAFARLVMPEDWVHLEKECAKLMFITSPESLSLKKQAPPVEIPRKLIGSKTN
jgi:phosphohistidine phosphatase